MLFSRLTSNASAYSSIADLEVIHPDNLKGKTVFDVVNDVSFRVLTAVLKLGSRKFY